MAEGRYLSKYTGKQFDDSVETALDALEKANSANSNIELLMSSMDEKVDGGYVGDDGCLYLTANGEVVIGPLGPFAGGAGGGGGSGNNASMTVRNATGWMAATISSGSQCELSLTWSSVEDETPTGDGTMTITVGGAIKEVVTVSQGTVTKDVAKYLKNGINKVKIAIEDIYGNSRSVGFTVTLTELSISSNFDSAYAYKAGEQISFAFVPVGAIEKTVYFYVDGSLVGTQTVTSTNRQQTFMLPSMSHGAHNILVYFTATIDSQDVRSNELYYDITVVDNEETLPIITSQFRTTQVSQYSTIAIPYSVYTPNSLNSQVGLYVNDELLTTLTVDRTEQIWSYRPLDSGELTLTIVSGAVSRVLTLMVAQADINAVAATDSLALYMTSSGRDNGEDNPALWEYGNISAELSNFNFVSDGWIKDENNITALRVLGDARVTIPYKPFASDFRTTGKTIEIEFATTNVMDYDTVIMSCMSGGRGFSITAQKAILTSEQSTIFTQYKENEHVRISFVVEKRSENRLIYIYINGIMSGVIRYPSDDDFSQFSPVDISIGSNDCTVDIYNIRVYDNNLTRYQVLENWIADTQDGGLMSERYSHNSVYDEYGNIVIANLPASLPYLVINAPQLPQYKGDKKTVSGYYVDPINPEKSFTFENANADVQGTSSQHYPRKNFKIKFNGGFVSSNGTSLSKYKLRSDSIATKTFTFKADVASSEGCNNVELVRLYDEACPYKTPAQVANDGIRQGIDGFPIVIFQNDGTGVKFIGKYNFNNDKGTPEVFGFTDGDESWEVLNNTSNRVVWKSANFSGNDWMNDFEARYPEDNVNTAQLAAFAAWVVSTDTSAATNATLPQSVTYGEDSYITDSAEYRLAKFRAELGDYVELDSALFYYLYTELFLLVDSRAKNMFPSFLGSSGAVSKKIVFLPYDMDTAIGM